jgi:hypothetical protein
VTELKGLKNNPHSVFQMAKSTGHAHAMLRASAEPVRMREHERVFQSQHNQLPHRHAPYVFAVFSMLSVLLMDNKSVDETFGQIYTIARIFILRMGRRHVLQMRSLKPRDFVVYLRVVAGTRLHHHQH